MSNITVTRMRSETAAGARHTELRCAQPPSRWRARRAACAAVALLVPLVLSLTVLAAPSASAISRNGVLARAQRWVDAPVRYSQARRHLGYRTDCSGYVSMCWRTGTSWSTRSFHTVSHRIPTSALKPGDALLKKGYHIRLFYGWVDDARTEYVAYESGSGTVAVCRIHSIADDLAFGYVPARYDRIRNSARPRNILQNGSFNVWARSWGPQPEQAVWWQTSGPPWEQVIAHRKGVYRSTHSSLELRNPSGDPATFTEISQSTPVVAGADYRLSGWAKTAFDPRGVELRLAYLNAIGETVAETSIAGDNSYLDASTFRQMSVLLAAPADAVRALVSVRLAGGTTTDASGTIVPGTSVTLDDISLARPQVTVGIKTSATTAYNGKTVVLSGSVNPNSAIGAPAVIWVQRPGSGWKQLSTSRIYASGSAAAWKHTYRFTRSMRRGTYRFKTSIPGIPGYLGATTSAASVRLR